ncbi:transposase [Nocardiopsis baichengensis]|uniref:transposase n=1 Tax=Nocardiopsis baichengensis TaxID=280240 RepID=UPI0003467862|nr:transposase [Nocardiopsis baichengensis]
MTELQQLMAPLVPGPKPGGRPPVHERRCIAGALACWVRPGCAWRPLPHDLLPWKTLYHHWRLWRIPGRREQILYHLRGREQLRLGRDPEPSADAIGSPSVRAADRGGEHGYDGAKKGAENKHHIMVDVPGTP